MTKSLKEMRAGGRASLPERTYTLCLSQSLVAEAQALEEERALLALPKRTDDEDAPPTRVGQGEHPRVAEITERLDGLLEEMREHTGELRLRAIAAGEWRRWADDNPAREDSKVDEIVGYNMCDTSALLDRLGDFAAAWEGEALAEGDWEFIRDSAAPGDLKEICRVVVSMHEAGGFRPKASQTPSSATPPSETGSDSPAA